MFYSVPGCNSAVDVGEIEEDDPKYKNLLDVSNNRDFLKKHKQEIMNKIKTLKNSPEKLDEIYAAKRLATYLRDAAEHYRTSIQ